jgi:hypothetical protein
VLISSCHAHIRAGYQHSRFKKVHLWQTAAYRLTPPFVGVEAKAVTALLAVNPSYLYHDFEDINSDLINI